MASNKTTVQELIDSNPAHLSESWSSDSDSDSSSFDYDTVKDLLPPGFLDPLPKTQTSISIESSREDAVETSNAVPVLDSSKGPDSLPLSKQSKKGRFSASRKARAKLGDNGYIRRGDLNGQDDVRTLRKRPSNAGGFLVDEISSIDTQKVVAMKRANDSSSASQEMPRRDNLSSKRIKGCYMENHSSRREEEEGQSEDQNAKIHSSTEELFEALAKLRRGDIGGKSKITYLMELLKKYNYIHDEKPVLGKQLLESIVFAPPETLNLIRLNPRVIVIDATNKTNISKFPLIEIIGIVSTGNNIHLAFAFISKVHKENYLWILQWIKALYDSCGANGPNIIVTNRELALMDAIDEVFPHVVHLLCRRYIKMDCQSWLARKTKTKMYEKKFGSRWDAVVFAPTKTAYEVALESLWSSFRKHADFLAYLDRTWLTPYRKRFVSAWTKEYMHFGTETTNMAEDAYFLYKHMLEYPNNTLVRCFKILVRLMELQHEKIRNTFEASLIKVHPHCHISLFHRLSRKVSHKAIELMHAELVRIEDPRYCTCELRQTHGLPCACEMMSLRNKHRPIDPEKHVDVFWRTLTM